MLHLILNPSIFTILFLISCGQKEETVMDFDNRPRVRIHDAQQLSGTQEKLFSAPLRAYQTLPLTFQIGGLLRAPTAQTGLRVSSGENLLALDSDEARARVALQKAQLANATLQHEEALLAFNQVKALASSRAAAELERAELRVKSSQEAINIAEQQLEMARIHQNRHTLQAPFSGVLKLNELVGGMIVSPGIPLGTLIDDSAYRVIIDMNEADRARAAQASFSCSCGKVIQVQLSDVPEQNRRWSVELDIEKTDPQANLLLSSMVTIKATFPPPQADAIIPLSALDDKNKVWVVDSKNILEPRSPEIVLEEHTNIYVRGIQPSERVVLYPSASLQKGQEVTLIEAP